MALKIIEATELRVGSFLTIEGEHYSIKSIDVSKTGKHGHAKCRFEAVSLTGGRKKVMVVPGHERFEVPMIDKRKAQVLNVNGNTANLMDSESFENMEIEIPEDLQDQVTEGGNVEYWDMEGQKIIKRSL
jgi:translation initiation factor 5A